MNQLQESGESVPLEDLAEQISAEHQLAVDTTMRAFQHWVRVGELLQQAKEQVGHGGWIAWVESNLPFNRVQASKYMRVAREKKKFLSDVHSGDHSVQSLNAAVKMLGSAPDQPLDSDPEPPEEPDEFDESMSREELARDVIRYYRQITEQIEDRPRDENFSLVFDQVRGLIQRAETRLDAMGWGGSDWPADEEAYYAWWDSELRVNRAYKRWVTAINQAVIFQLERWEKRAADDWAEIIPDEFENLKRQYAKTRKELYAGIKSAARLPESEDELWERFTGSMIMSRSKEFEARRKASGGSKLTAAEKEQIKDDALEMAWWAAEHFEVYASRRPGTKEANKAEADAREAREYIAKKTAPDPWWIDRGDGE